MDGTTYTDIFAADLNIHEGWNYQSWDSGNYQKYRFYRFSGPDSDICLMNEIKFTGVETIDSNTPLHECDVKLIIQGAE